MYLYRRHKSLFDAALGILVASMVHAHDSMIQHHPAPPPPHAQEINWKANCIGA